MERTNNLIYEFGPYRLDVEESVLMLDGRPVPLTPKAFETLLVLVQNNGHVVQKEDLMKQVWRDACVEEANLTQNIFTLRRVLGKTADKSRYIETIPRRGYRFVASVRVSNSCSLLAELNRSDQLKNWTADTRSELTNRSLAVLPFINASSDADMEYLSDGITESIINSLSQLHLVRVMSRNAVFAYKGKELDAQRIGRELDVGAILVGRVHSREDRLLISAELVDVANGWQLWGKNYDRRSRAIFDVQEEMARQISAALRVELSGDDEQRITKRYTENPEAYRAYLKGRYHWAKYTRAGLERATVDFRQAIDLDPYYALAYMGIVDCYMRLATNYIPPADVLSTATFGALGADELYPETQPFPGTVKVRYEWDRKSAERELKRAIELKSSYPAPHQWYAAYLFSLNMSDDAVTKVIVADCISDDRVVSVSDVGLLGQIQSSDPMASESVQVFCTIAREQIEAGNYEAACLALKRWWTIGQWPKLEDLSPQSSADLLLTTGALTGCVASTRQVSRGQKHAEALLNGAVALLEQLGLKTRSAEGKIELAYCYYREGFFDLARSTLLAALEGLSDQSPELRSLGLIRLAIVERHAGRLHDSLAWLHEAAEVVEMAGPWVTGRYHVELATTLKDLGIAETRNEYFDQAQEHYQEALYQFEAVGNHRYAATVENNHGYLLLTLKRFDEAEAHLLRARRLFDGFADKVRRAQVDETLAQLYLAARQFQLAEQSILRAVKTLEIGGEEALLGEALTTHGLVLCKLGRHREAKRVLDRANQVAERCGDREGAGRALLIVIEEMCEELEDDERLEVGGRLRQFLAHSQQSATLERLRKCLDLIDLRAMGNSQTKVRIKI